MNAKSFIRLVVGVAVPLIVLLLPRDAIGWGGLTVMEQRMIALFLFAMLFWVLEPIPIFATSTVVIVLALLFMSDKGFSFARPPEAEPGTSFGEFGKVLDHRQLMGTFADPIIMLFLGGFFLGAAATKYRMDKNLGRVLLRPFGRRPATVMLGMMVVTAVFSMFMSNTATTAMMLAVLLPVLKSMDEGDPARVAFALAIPFAANIGGIGTPIGTPPNAVAIKYFRDPTTGKELISFAEWMGFAVPYVVVCLLIVWAILLLMYRPQAKQIDVAFGGRWMRSPKAIVVYVTSTVTILLWVLSSPLSLGLSSPVIAMIPVAVFTATGVINSADLKQMGWDVLWLVAGGFALGLGLMETGLSETLINSLPFSEMPALAIVLVACALAYLMASFMSNTATANLILPIMAVLGTTLASLQPLGGHVMLLLSVTLCCSLAMTMPISTPPNAMAYATGWIKTGQMAKAGFVVGLVAMLLVAGLVTILKLTGFFAM